MATHSIQTQTDPADAAISTRAAGQAAPVEHRLRRPRPWLALIAAISFALTVRWAATRTSYFVTPDELFYSKQALQIGRELGPLLPGDLWFVSYAQLGPLLMAPLYRLFAVGTAFDLAHVLQAALMASTALPAYLIAARVTRSRPAALLVAALTVAIPWMVLAGTLMTEPLAYPAFAWAAWAIHATIATPSVRNDSLALALIALAFLARAQHVILAPVLVGAILLHELGYARARSSELSRLRALRAAAAATARSHPVVAAATALGALLLLGGLSSQTVLGGYSDVTGRDLLPAGTGRWAHELFVQLAVGVGVMPVVLAAAWAASTLARPAESERHAFAALLVVAVSATVLLVGVFSAQRLAEVSLKDMHDRYIFYVVPLIFVGMAALLSERRRATVALAVAGAGGALLLATADTLGSARIPPMLSPGAGIGPRLGDFGDSLGRLLGELDPATSTVLAILTALATAALVAARRRFPAARVAVVVGALALAYCLAATASTAQRLEDQIPRDAFVRVMTPHKGWPDDSLSGDARVTLLTSPNSGTFSRPRDAWTYVAFWSERIDRIAYLGAESIPGLPAQPIAIDPRSGRVDGLGRRPYIVRPRRDMRLRLRGERVLERAGLLSLVRAPLPHTAAWTLRGAGLEGALQLGTTAVLRVFGGPGAAGRRRVSIALRAPLGAAAGAIRYRLRSGARVATGSIAWGVDDRITAPVELPAAGFAELRLDVSAGPAAGGFFGARVADVTVEPW